MPIRFSPQTLEALALVISGGSANDQSKPIGIYRSGPKLESLMRGCNVSMSVGSGSRMPALVEALERAGREGDQTILKTIVQRAADLRDFLDDPEKAQTVVDYLNARLTCDGLELQRMGNHIRLGTPGRSSRVVEALADAVVVLDFDSVSRDLKRALANIDRLRPR